MSDSAAHYEVLEDGSMLIDGDMVTVVFSSRAGVRARTVKLEKQEVMDMLKRPIWLLKKSEPRKMYTFSAPGNVSVFMLGRDFTDYTLYVGKKTYEWPRTSDVDVVADHIRYCMDLESAFYDTESCTDFFKRQRESKRHWSKQLPDEVADESPKR